MWISTWGHAGILREKGWIEHKCADHALRFTQDNKRDGFPMDSEKQKQTTKKGAIWLHGMNNSFSFPPAILPPLIFLFLLLPVGFFCWIQLSSWFTKKPYFWMNAFWKVSKDGFCFLSLSQTTYGILHLKIWLHFSACNSSVNCY